jgi:putative ATP-binding cassette transporter
MTKIPLFDLIRSETATRKSLIILAAIIAGIAHTVSIGIVNEAAQSFVNHSVFNAPLFKWFAGSMILFVVTQTYSLTKAVHVIEAGFYNTRLRIAEKIRHVEWSFIEGRNKGEIYMSLTRDGNLISTSAMVLVIAGQGVVVAFFSFIYIAWLSLVAFCVLSVMTALLVVFYFGRIRHIRKNIQAADKHEIYFFGLLNHLLTGFKEIKLNRKKSDELFSRIEEVADASRHARMTVGEKFVFHAFAVNLMQSLLLGAIVFVIPQYSASHLEVVTPLIAITLFASGYISMVLHSIRHFVQVNEAIRNMQRLEEDLDRVNRPFEQVDSNAVQSLYGFGSIELSGVEYVYRDEEGCPLFPFGPLSLKITKGELLFVVGGNGSGKTTFLKLLTGLYFPHAGQINIDGRPVDLGDYALYRNLFSGVFSDFHLFDQLYGLREISDRTVDDWLERMQLEKKTRFESGRFSTLDLSTGQRKRLAFIVSMLEKRPICIFDELAADQDPEFRSIFYNEILPDLKKQGKTVIAISHDDRYWHVADRVVKFEYGKLVDVSEADSRTE